MFDLIICCIDYIHCIECIHGVYSIAFVVFCSRLCEYVEEENVCLT